MDCEHHYQELYDAEGEHCIQQMARMRVEGGWLYICECTTIRGHRHISVAMESVPDTKRTGQGQKESGSKRT